MSKIAKKNHFLEGSIFDRSLGSKKMKKRPVGEGDGIAGRSGITGRGRRGGGAAEVGVEVAGGGGKEAGKDDEMCDKGEIAVRGV